MSTNPYESPREPVAEPVAGGVVARSDGLHEYLLSAHVGGYWRRVGFYTRKIYAQRWAWSVCLLLILAMRRWMGLRLARIDYVVIGLLLMPLALALIRSVARKKITERVEATSADAAVETLRERGFTEIVLHTDDVGALFTKVAPRVTPKDYVALRNFGGYWERVGFHAQKLYAQGWLLSVLFVVMFAARRWRQLPFGITDYMAIGVLLMPLAFAVMMQLNNRAVQYHKFLELVAWGRWAEVLEQAEGLHGRLPEHERLWYKAKALAALGRIDEAIQLVAPIAADPTAPQWHYCSRLSGIYAVADMRDKELAMNEKTLDLAPENATVLVDMAMSLLRYQVDTPRARQLIERARSHALSDVLAPTVDAVEGVLLLEEGRPHEANQKLLAGIEGRNNFRNPLMAAMQDRFRAYLALSYAAMGDRPAAERELRLAEPRLRALKRNDLLDRCQRAIGTVAASDGAKSNLLASPALPAGNDLMSIAADNTNTGDLPLLDAAEKTSHSGG